MVFGGWWEVLDERDGGEGEVGVLGEGGEEGFGEVLLELVLQNRTADGDAPYLKPKIEKKTIRKQLDESERQIVRKSECMQRTKAKFLKNV